MQECKAYVGNLSYSVTDDQLKQLFANHGEVKDVVIIKDKMTGRSKGFGFVEFSSEEELSSAIEALNDKEFEGRKLRVNKARKKPDK
ncbi:MAG: RNA-binding protein [Elusimicrobia bacterium]|nr:RNA-binding protein [Elusimicrobiota bacterium]